MNVTKINQSIDKELSVPWCSCDEWLQAKKTLFLLKQKFRPNLKKAENMANSLDQVLKQGFVILDGVCMETCCYCPEICCINAHVWADFTDLVYWTLKDISFPSHQLTNIPEKGCSYLTKDGCRLTRLQRPWICTWYVCPTQTNALHKHGHWEAWQEIVLKIKHARNMMFDEFIKAVS